MSAKLKKLEQIYNIPEEANSIINDILTDEEIDFILSIEKSELSINEIKSHLKPGIQNKEEIEKYYKRGIINKKIVDNQCYYKITDLYTRLEYFVLEDIERWNSYDKEIISSIKKWYRNEYEKFIKAYIDSTGGYPKETVLPIEEARKVIENTNNKITLMPCDCRVIEGACDKLIETCIHFGEKRLNGTIDRGFGKSISKEEAIEVLEKADKNGLVHSVSGGAICNCCTCCCYPFNAALKYETKGLWPMTKYVAALDERKCISCGKCVDKCMFNALEIKNKKITLDQKKCWGCGVCRAACSKGAIYMKDQG